MSLKSQNVATGLHLSKVAMDNGLISFQINSASGQVSNSMPTNRLGMICRGYSDALTVYTWLDLLAWH